MTAMAVGAADNKEKRAERAGTKEMKLDADQRIRDINRLDNRQEARLAGLRSVSQETGVPVPTLEAQHKAHPKAGVAGLLVANDIAVRSHADVNELLRAHSTGKSWVEIARNHGVSVSDLDTKLNRVESDMKAAK